MFGRRAIVDALQSAHEKTVLAEDKEVMTNFATLGVLIDIRDLLDDLSTHVKLLYLHQPKD